MRFDKNHQLTVFVECSNCHYLVARYLLQQYIDPNAPFDAFLQQIRQHAGDSGRKMLDDIKSYRENMAHEFDDVKIAWREHPVKRKIYEVLQQDDWGYDDFWGA
jgi:hypothetical protein